MPPLEIGEVKNRDFTEKTCLHSITRCRIPQRLVLPNARTTNNTNKPNNSQGVHVTNLYSRNTTSTRPRSETRAKSLCNRSETSSVKQRTPRQDKNAIQISSNVKKSPGQARRFQNGQRVSKREEMEMTDQETKILDDLEQQSRDEQNISVVRDLKTSWENDICEFENLKRDLSSQQQNIIELYARLKNTHKTMLCLEQKVTIPKVEDLKIMDVAKLNPDQLLQLCASTEQNKEKRSSSPKLSIDLNKFFEMPTKLVATCELTLVKRKEIIDWFQTLKSEERGISMNKLTKKINEFNAENETLYCTLNACKADFIKELTVFVDQLRKDSNDTIDLQVRIEELTCETSQLNAQNMDLRKQLQAIESLKSTQNKYKCESLEKILKEEKCKKMVIKDKLTRAEAQLKTSNERNVQLDAALELARSQNWTLERTVQQLNDENNKLQLNFDTEISKLNDSIKENSVHFDEIVKAKEELQTEKEELESRLEALSKVFNESNKKLTDELNENITKLSDIAQKYDVEQEERKKLESNLESLCSQLIEAEIRYKELIKQMQAKNEEIKEMMTMKNDLNATKLKLEAANLELQVCKNRLHTESSTLLKMEENFQEAVKLERSLKSDIRNKEKVIAELEKNRSLLEQQLHEGEHKMEMYEHQLNSLKNEISQVHEEFGEFESMDQLHGMINEQRTKLLESTRQNEDLVSALHQKEAELESHLQEIAQQQELLHQRNSVIKMLSEKEEEQANIIKLLRNNIEMRAQADNDLNQQLIEKKAEVDSLIKNLETRKQQISQLEKIILTLEEQLRKVYLQRKKDHNKMTQLEKALADCETFPAEIKQSVESPVDNLDNLIKILEDELDTSHPKQNKFHPKNKLYDDHRNCATIEQLAEGRFNELTCMLGEHRKPITRNQRFVGNRDRDNLDRKKAITNMETQKWLTNLPPIEVFTTAATEKKLATVKGMAQVTQMVAGQRDDKKGKMLKLAGHNLKMY